MKVTVPTKQGAQEITAAPVGKYFAIHKTLFHGGLSPTQLTLTHIQTGRAVRHDLCCRESAKALAATITPLANWDFTLRKDRLNVPLKKAQQQEMRAVVKIVREWKCPKGCL